MITRQRNPKPNEGKEGIGQPVHPAQILFFASVGKQEIHPYIEELVRTQARDEVRLENAVSQITAADVVISFDLSDAPSERSLGKHYSRRPMGDGYGLVAHCVSELESTLSRKPCKRALNPAGSSKTRSSPVMTSILRVLS